MKKKYYSPCLYILMRTDMDSMNPGKAMAQACHAANQFVYLIKRYGSAEQKAAFRIWEEEGQTFGTTIVLNGGDMDNIHHHLNSVLSPNTSGFVIDTGYPVRDGKVTHSIEVPTCGWIFVLNRDLERGGWRPDLPLHR